MYYTFLIILQKYSVWLNDYTRTENTIQNTGKHWNRDSTILKNRELKNRDSTIHNTTVPP